MMRRPSITKLLGQDLGATSHMSLINYRPKAIKRPYILCALFKPSNNTGCALMYLVTFEFKEQCLASLDLS